MKINLNKLTTAYDIAAWILMAVVLIFTLMFKLLPALLSGLLVYQLIHILTPYVAKKLPGSRAKIISIALLAIIIVGLLTLAGAGLVTFFRSESGSLTVLLAKMAQIIEDSRKSLPPWVIDRLPADAITF